MGEKVYVEVIYEKNLIKVQNVRKIHVGKILTISFK